MDTNFEGFDDFSHLIEKYISKADIESIMSALEVGADELVRDVRALPQPRRAGTGYTHLLDTISTKRNGQDVEVGWGKYYGTMVERGTSKMSARPHMKPTFERNADKYYKKMQKALFD